MPKLIDLTGQKYGKLTALEPDCYYIPPSGLYKALMWKCRCDCGNIVSVRGVYLRRGHTATCGHCEKIVEHDGYFEYFSKSGKSFLFDKCDIQIAKAHRWSIDNYGYATSVENGHHVKFHRLVCQAQENEVVDHINGVKSDCRRKNLRCNTQQQNTFNALTPKNSTTGYKGVCWDKSKGKYMAHIHPNRTFRFLGYYDTPEKAAAAYNTAAIDLFGEHARLNVIGQPFTTVPNNDDALSVEVFQ